ncbi:trypsin-like cysteine/serine peptidase domain-containing protein [Hypoxylon trugodes]|uniref:trypsin-like cysteine/serine peptidase domain-containing protein n=1 Tax=Hypoxylon trugodes TaxID=326681 RepID=UPI00219A37F0|nr:trypsin-like cysteine/serine peptidase domain-containing protein [Hypoxylon trugodes]KAI1384088.1 trypsin-like cysteine/serine peptidase domain-containing protein [Hypoxylon trugodes]
MVSVDHHYATGGFKYPTTSTPFFSCKILSLLGNFDVFEGCSQLFRHAWSLYLCTSLHVCSFDMIIDWCFAFHRKYVFISRRSYSMAVSSDINMPYNAFQAVFLISFLLSCLSRVYSLVSISQIFHRYFIYFWLIKMGGHLSKMSRGDKPGPLITSLHAADKSEISPLQSGKDDDFVIVGREKTRTSLENTVVLVDLEPPPCGPAVPEGFLPYGNQLELVATEEIQPGLAAHAVAYIETWSGRVRCSYGTGAVIHGNIVVTVGHVLMSSSGPVTAVRVTVGRGPTSESRHGTRVAFNLNWCTTGAIANDVALIELNLPFDNVRPLNYGQSPVTDENGVDSIAYGFPNTGTSVPCGQLYKSTAPLKYNPALNIFEHWGDTDSGSSGGPLIDNSEKVIALHWGYHKQRSVNLAVAIDCNGNNFADLFRALDVPVPNSASHN